MERKFVREPNLWSCCEKIIVAKCWELWPSAKSLAWYAQFSNARCRENAIWIPRFRIWTQNTSFFHGDFWAHGASGIPKNIQRLEIFMLTSSAFYHILEAIVAKWRKLHVEQRCLGSHFIISYKGKNADEIAWLLKKMKLIKHLTSE